jgi:hypothetical protein
VVNATTTTLVYGSAELEGKNSTDSVYLKNPDLGLASFPFLAITKQTGISSTFDGILGLSRAGSDYDNGPLFVEQARAAGQLTSETVSFYMDKASGTNYADFGPW